MRDTSTNSGKALTQKRGTSHRAGRLAVLRHQAWFTGALLLGCMLSGDMAEAAPGKGFYSQVPSDLASFAPGALLKSEPETEFIPQLNAFSMAYRIMYRSVGQYGNATAVTGMVFVPRGAPPAGGWPIVAWNHGTSGVGDLCAPSRHPDMYGGWPEYAHQIDKLLRQGWLVVATDYEGLGTPGLHPYLQTRSEGYAVIDGVRAARQRVPKAGSRWAAIGHSQGGQAALGAGEAVARHGEGLEFVGAVAYAPSQHFEASVDLFSRKKDLAPYLAYMAVGMKAIDPAFDYARFVGPAYLGRMDQAENHCFDQWFERDQGDVQANGGNVLNPDWALDPTVQRWFANHASGRQTGAAPVFIAQGMRDGLYETYHQYMTELCAAGTVTDSRIYSGISHDHILAAAWTDARNFLHTRFLGKPATNLCRRPRRGSVPPPLPGDDSTDS